MFKVYKKLFDLSKNKLDPNILKDMKQRDINILVKKICKKLNYEYKDVKDKYNITTTIINFKKKKNNKK